MSPTSHMMQLATQPTLWSTAQTVTRALPLAVDDAFAVMRDPRHSALCSSQVLCRVPSIDLRITAHPARRPTRRVGPSGLWPLLNPCKCALRDDASSTSSHLPHPRMRPRQSVSTCGESLALGAGSAVHSQNNCDSDASFCSFSPKQQRPSGLHSCMQRGRQSRAVCRSASPHHLVMRHASSKASQHACCPVHVGAAGRLPRERAPPIVGCGRSRSSSCRVAAYRPRRLISSSNEPGG